MKYRTAMMKTPPPIEDIAPVTNKVEEGEPAGVGNTCKKDMNLTNYDKK